MAILVCGASGLAEEERAAIEAFMSKFPPRSGELDSVVPCCRIQDAHDKDQKKFYVRLRPGYEEIEHLTVKILVQAGGKELYGQAPKGSLERKVADLLKQLGLDKMEL